MPIRPENRRRYPATWKAVRAAILERAGNCCEGSPAYPDCRAANGERHPITGSRVVLTIAYLDHTPEHCDPSNLRAWCQRCHLTYDARHHLATRRIRNLGSAQLTLFDWSNVQATAPADVTQ
jgi:5-methylcytosine-specific restriction endonuclease McrA